MGGIPAVVVVVGPPVVVVVVGPLVVVVGGPLVVVVGALVVVVVGAGVVVVVTQPAVEQISPGSQVSSQDRQFAAVPSPTQAPFSQHGDSGEPAHGAR